MNKLMLSVLTVLLSAFPALSFAALDAAVETGITAAKTDLLALLAALTTAGIAVFVGKVVYRYFKLR